MWGDIIGILGLGLYFTRIYSRTLSLDHFSVFLSFPLPKREKYRFVQLSAVVDYFLIDLRI